MTTVAVIDAGLAGTAASRALQEAGVAVRLFDKGRGAGGRMSTRRMATPAGEAVFDHGAQWFAAREPAFAAAVQGWAADGACLPWSGRLLSFRAGAPRPMSTELRWVGRGGMSSVVKAAMAGLDVRFGARVNAGEGVPGAWRLRLADGEVEGPFAAVLTAIPAEQTGPLLAGPAPFLAAEALAARAAPCWTALLAFGAPFDPGFDGAELDGPVAWAARERSKPGRPDLEAWTLQAGPDWSRAHLEDEAGEVAAALLAAFADRFGAPETIHLSAHRWRYARVEAAIGTAFTWDAALGIGTCGDWRLGPRVEAAWLSGRALGEAVSSRL